jgi:phosphoglycerate dehydrogenase-like enzyme
MAVLLLGFDQDLLSEAHLAQVQAAAPDMQVVLTRDRGQITSLLDDIEIAAGGFPYDLLARARNLRWLQQWGAGADWLLRHPEVVDLPFVLTNASGVHAIPISEHILSYLLAFARQLPEAVRIQDRRIWRSPNQDALFELNGKTLLLIGVGAIGARTAAIASALGMRVQGVRRNWTSSVPGVAAMFAPEQLIDLLPEADFAVLTVPLSRATQAMIGERELRAMKPSAYLVNIGRGGTIQEDALVRALQRGWIAGAALDVFAHEPLAPDSALWSMGNVIITAHYAGSTPHYHERAMAIFLDNLRRYRSGEPLRNVVDKQAGY